MQTNSQPFDEFRISGRNTESTDEEAVTAAIPPETPKWF
jgi:hypothetical protein